MFAVIFSGQSEANLRAAKTGDWKWTKIKDVHQAVSMKFANFHQITVGNTGTAAVAGRIKALYV